MDNELKAFWKKLGGQDRLADGFVSEIKFFLNQVPAINAEDGRKQATVERQTYREIANQCDGLLKALEKIPDLDRLNILSLRERRTEYGDKTLPICDPLDYVKTIKENSEFHAEEFGRAGVTKFSRQLYSLKNFIKRFPPCMGINRSSFIELATILWKPYAGSVNANDHGKNIEAAIDAIGFFKPTLKLPQNLP